MKIWLKRRMYAIARRVVAWIARPTLSGLENLHADADVIYVLQQRALSDLIVLDLVCAQNDLVSPLTPIEAQGFSERSRFFPLLRAASDGRITMQSYSGRMTRLVSAPDDFKRNAMLVPVSVFWGRAMSGEGTLLKLFTSEHWAMTGRLKRLINLFINRRNIIIHLGRSVPVAQVTAGEESVALRRTARLLRVRLRRQKVRTLGPDFSHRRTLINQIVRSTAVRRVIDHRVSRGEKLARLERQAARHAQNIASDMSHPTIRVLSRLLSWFWTRIYNGIEIEGVNRLGRYSETHTLVYVPSHRSHLDYLLLSYLLYYRGHMIPHIAAGDNLDLPIVGSILRRGGAFFMRRSFRGDALYAAVFEEYLYQVYRRGHCVEFFPEGGRTRTGRLLPARFGLLKMTLEHQQRGLPRPLAFVPVYISYEKLVEASSYLSELRGADKKKESLFDLFRNLRLLRQNFGEVVVNVGRPIPFDKWLQRNGELPAKELLAQLGRDIMFGINSHAHINPVNLVALVTLATPKLAIEESQLLEQIACYQTMAQRLHGGRGITVTDASPAEVLAHAQALQLIDREEHAFGAVLSHSQYTGVLMTWYRNNVAHAFALPSLLACLLIRRRLAIDPDRLQRMASIIYPSLAVELSTPEQVDYDAALALLLDMGLLRLSEDQITTPPADDPRHAQLELLANLVMQTLERMFIVVHQLANGAIGRDELRARSQAIAQRISRLYGINAPEFSDPRLFDQFIEFLVDRKVVTRDEDGLFEKTDLIDEVVRTAEHVIEPRLRRGVLLATHQV